MNLNLFINKLLNQNIDLKNVKLILFYGNEYPLLLMRILKKYLVNYLGIKKVVNVDVSSLDSRYFINELKQGSIEGKLLYWISNIENKLKSKNLASLIENKKQYNDKIIITWINRSNITLSRYLNDKAVFIVELDYKINKNFIEHILKTRNEKLSSNQLISLLNLIQNKNLSLDKICLIMDYIKLSNRKDIDDLLEYLQDMMIEEDLSLKKLTNYFFEYNKSEFMNLWFKIYGKYSDIFWIGFWHEKFYKAYFILQNINSKNNLSSKLKYGIPYFFFKNHKLYREEQLSGYDKFLYDLNFRLKEGSLFSYFELLFIRHFFFEFPKFRVKIN